MYIDSMSVMLLNDDVCARDVEEIEYMSVIDDTYYMSDISARYVYAAFKRLIDKFFGFFFLLLFSYCKKAFIRE